MIDSRNIQPTAALFGSLKTVVLLLGAVWGLSHFLSLHRGGGPQISALGDYTPLYFPEAYKMELTDLKGQRREMQSLWKFDIKNEGDVEAKDLTFELPFNGFYQIQGARGTPGRLADFEKTIHISELDPSNPISILVWSDSSADADYEKDTRVSLAGASVQVDYPVKVRGLLAWIERSKLLISVMVFVAVVLTLL